MIFYLALLASQLTGTAIDEFASPPWVSEESKSLVVPYWDCVHEVARKYEISGEQADLVARAAIRACDDDRNQLLGSIIADEIMYSETGDGLDILRRFDETITSSVVQVVVEIRAAS